MKLLLGTLVFTVASSLFPLLNAEIFLAAVATRIHAADALPLALASGAGQTLGKVVWYVLSERSLQLPWLRRRTAEGRFREQLDLWTARIDGRPWAAGGVMLASSLIGFPPLLVTAVAAGVVRMRLWIFCLTVFVGRVAQSYLILAGLVGLLHALHL